MATYQYTKSPVYQSALIREIVAAGIDKPEMVTVNGTQLVVQFEEALTSGEEISLQTVVTAHPDLDEYKKMKTAKIDARTAELIAAGFTFDSTKFSASIPAQKNLLYVLLMLNLKMTADLMEQMQIVVAELGLTSSLDMRNETIWTYMRSLSLPHEMSTHEDDLTIEYELPTELSVLQVCLTCASTVLTAYNGGRDLKKDVRDATTHAAVDAVEDNR